MDPMRTRLLDCFAASAYFKGLSVFSREALAGIGRPRRLRKSELIFLEGDRGQAMYLLSEGHVQVSKAAEDGSETVIKVLGAGEVFAEVVLFESDRYPASAIALTDGILFEFPRAAVHLLLEKPDFRNDFIAMLMRKQRYLASRLHDMTKSDVEARLLAFFRESYGERKNFEVPISKKEVAAAIGATPETLSRLLKRLEKSGVLSWKGREVVMGSKVRRGA